MRRWVERASTWTLLIQNQTCRAGWTASDLASCSAIEANYVSEAIQYRNVD